MTGYERARYLRVSKVFLEFNMVCRIEKKCIYSTMNLKQFCLLVTHSLTYAEAITHGRWLNLSSPSWLLTPLRR